MGTGGDFAGDKSELGGGVEKAWVGEGGEEKGRRRMREVAETLILDAFEGAWIEKLRGQ